MKKFVFGPVNSRRLGISLGIDLLPYKTCSLDCIYCECSKTTRYCVERENFFDWKNIVGEIDSFLAKSDIKLDYITFSGSGEPLLYKNIKKVIAHIKTTYPHLKIALLTNSTLLHQKDVIDDIKGIDLLVPSLDSATQEGFNKIDKPSPNFNIPIETIIESIKNAKNSIKGETWLEIFIVPGINDTEDELLKLKNAVKYINPHKIQINSIDRPGTEKWIKPLPQDKREYIEKFLSGEIIHKKNNQNSDLKNESFRNNNSLKGKIVELLSTKPHTHAQITSALNETDNDVADILHFLVENNAVVKKITGDEIYYSSKNSWHY